jgi:hypothetical protein
MYYINLRYFEYLQGRKIALILLLCCSLSATYAQRASSNYNYLDFNQKPYYFGITLGYNTNNFQVYRSKSFFQNDSTKIVNGVKGPGFNLGVVTNLKIGEYFDIRFLPTLSFADRRVSYTKPKAVYPQEDKFDAVLVELPFHIRYKSAPYQDKRLFVIAGAKYSYDVASNSKSRQRKDGQVKAINVSPTDFQLETGVGMQFYFPFFIFSPEIKFSQGLNNIMIYDKNLYKGNILEKVYSRALTISFHFEG